MGLSCSRCNSKPEFSSIAEVRYAVVDDVNKRLNPQNIPSSQKFDSFALANRFLLKHPGWHVVTIKDFRRL